MIIRWPGRAKRLHEQLIAGKWELWSDEDKHFIALSLCGEVGELANFIKKEWRDKSADHRASIIKEMADVRILLEMIARAYSVDLNEACEDKLDELSERWNILV